MSSEAGHIQITEFNKEVIPSINWMMEDLFCQYGVSLPWFMCDFKFPDYSQRPEWYLPEGPTFLNQWPTEWSGYNFNLDWGAWGYWLVKFNEMLGLLFDEAHLPRWQMPDLSPASWAFFNDYVSELYDNMQRHYAYEQSGTFTKDEVIEGEDSGVTGYYKWKDGDGYLHICRKQDATDEPVADFEEEKITGQTSGAYTWTVDWTRQNIFDSVGTFTVGETVEGATSEATAIIRVVADDYLMLSDVVGTFSDDEKIVGETSGAYAFTSESTWSSPKKIYAYAGGTGIGEGEPKALWKNGVSMIDFDTAWANYQAHTPSIKITGNISWACWVTPPSGYAYSATGQEVCISFNTTGAPAGATTITLNVDIDSKNGNPVLKIYRLDEVFDPSHWLTGGTLITSETITTTGVHSYSLTYDDIHQGDWSRFRLSLAILEAQVKPEANVVQAVSCRQEIEDYAYLEFIR